MPIYEYACASCGEVFEVLQRFSDPPIKACSSCGAANPEKLISAAAFHLKGSGWYKTDYASPSKKSKTEGKISASDSRSGSDSGSGSAEGGIDKGSPKSKASAA